MVMKAIPDMILRYPETDGRPLPSPSRMAQARAAAERIVGPGIASVFDQAVVSGTNFLTTLIIARSCTQDELGIYSLAWTIVMFMAALQCNLITVPYTMYCHRHEGASLAEYAGSTLIQQLLTSATAMIGFFGLDLVLATGWGPERLRATAWVLLGVIPLLLMREYARRFALAHLAVSIAVVIDVVVSVLQIGTLLVLRHDGMLSAAAVYVAMGAACGVACLCWWAMDRQPMRFSLARFPADARRNWSFGRWAFLSQLTGLSFYGLPWILAAVHGEAQTGVLAACTTLVGLLNLFVMGMNNYLMPKAAREFAADGSLGLYRVLRKAMLYSSLVLGSLCVALYFAGNVLAVIVYGNDYAHAGPLIAVLGLATFADAMGLIASTGLWAMDRPAVGLIGDVMQLVVMLAAAIWLVFPYGAMGITIALVAGRLTGAAARWVTLWMLLRSPRCQWNAI